MTMQHRSRILFFILVLGLVGVMPEASAQIRTLQIPDRAFFLRATVAVSLLALTAVRPIEKYWAYRRAREDNLLGIPKPVFHHQPEPAFHYQPGMMPGMGELSINPISLLDPLDRPQTYDSSERAADVLDPIASIGLVASFATMLFALRRDGLIDPAVLSSKSILSLTGLGGLVHGALSLGISYGYDRLGSEIENDITYTRVRVVDASFPMRTVRTYIQRSHNLHAPRQFTTATGAAMTACTTVGLRMVAEALWRGRKEGATSTAKHIALGLGNLVMAGYLAKHYRRHYSRLSELLEKYRQKYTIDDQKNLDF